MLREWRGRRRMSQLDLASVAEVSTRHLSYVETGRSTPSRELVLHLARHLDVPLREQNDLLLAAGQAVGAWVAARFATGNPQAETWIRRLLIAVVLASLVKFAVSFWWS